MSRQLNEEDIRETLDAIEREVSALPRIHAGADTESVNLKNVLAIIANARARLGLTEFGDLPDEMKDELEAWQDLGRESLEISPDDEKKRSQGA